jgi:hypothetical protein
LPGAEHYQPVQGSTAAGLALGRYAAIPIQTHSHWMIPSANFLPCPEITNFPYNFLNLNNQQNKNTKNA